MPGPELLMGEKIRRYEGFCLVQGGSGTKPGQETGTVGTVFSRNRKQNQNRRNHFPGTETETGTVLSW